MTSGTRLVTSVMLGMIEEISQDYANFSDWFAAFVEIANIEIGGEAAKMIRRWPAIYQENYLDGQSPREAFCREWL